MAMHVSTLSYQHCQQYKLYEHNRTNQSTGLLVAQVYYKQKLHQRLCNEIIMVSLAYVKLKATNFIYLIILFNRNSLDCSNKIQIMLTIKTRSKWEKKLWAELVFQTLPWFSRLVQKTAKSSKSCNFSSFFENRQLSKSSQKLFSDFESGKKQVLPFLLLLFQNGRFGLMIWINCCWLLIMSSKVGNICG